MEGQLAITEAARRLVGAGRSLELAAIPAEGSLVPSAPCPDIPVHCDLATARAPHSSALDEARQAWRTDGWPAGPAYPLTD